MKRTTALGACVALAAGSFALMPSAQAAPKQPAILRAGGAVKPAAPGELTASFTLAQTASQKSLTKSLAGKRSHGISRSFASTQPAVAHRDAVLGWARASGFRVVHSSRFLVTVAGPSAELAAALGTSLKRAGDYTVPVTAPAVPAALRRDAESVVGADNRPVYRPHAAYGPADVRAMSHMPVQSSSAGAGVTIGTANFSGWNSSNLTAFAKDPEADGDPAKAITLAPGQITELSVDGTNPGVDDGVGGGGEVALDAEAILAAAPGAHQRLYFGDNSSAGSLAIWDQMAADAARGLLQVVSTSWGVCESTYDGFASDLNAEANRIDTLVAAGVTVFASSGDSGAYDCSYEGVVDNTLDVDFPASHPRVVGVGGTSTQPAGSLTYTHQGWGPATVNTHPDTSTFQGSGSGGGYSSHFLNGPTGQPSSSTPGRQVPDIAALADPNTGMIINIDGVGVAGGTSLAAPLSAAGLAGVIGRTSPIAGHGNILPTLYANPSVTHDVQGNGNGYYAAGPGYDHVTGLGVMDWTAFAALLPTTIPAPTFTIPSYLRSTTFQVTVTGTPSSYTSWGMADASGADDSSAPSCSINNGSSAPTSFTIGAIEGRHTIWLTAMDTDGVCHAVSRTTFLDTQAPAVQGLKVVYSGTTAPRFTVSWALTDAAPSSGLVRSRLTLRDSTLGKVVYDKESTASSMVLNTVAGHSYTVTLNGYDRAGGTSAAAVKPFVSPTDDKAFAFSGFTRQNNAADYMGSHAVASRAGSYAKLTFTGKQAWVGVIKSRSSGLMDIYVDGVRTSRVDLYSASTLFRQQVKVLASTTPGTHTVVLKAVGAHRSGATGNNVYADSLTVA